MNLMMFNFITGFPIIVSCLQSAFKAIAECPPRHVADQIAKTDKTIDLINRRASISASRQSRLDSALEILEDIGSSPVDSNAPGSHMRR